MKKAFFAISLLMTVVGHLQAQAPFICTTNNGTITITGYNGPGGVINIPSVINGFPVTTIAPYAFEISGINPPVINSVIISNGVTTIGDHSFGFNLSMTNVTLPASLTDIGPYAFVGSPGLQNITIPGGVTNIEFSAFYNGGITSVVIPGNVITVGASVFGSCPALTNVVIENGVGSLGANAFSGAALTSVTIPASVTNVGSGPSAFASCYRLTSILADPGNPAFSSVGGILYNHDQTTLVVYPAGIAGSFTIPNIVNALGDYAFASCINLAGISLSNTSNSLLSIGSNCFTSTLLSNATIPASVTNIGSSVFLGCRNLAAIAVDPQNAFYSVSNGVLFDKAQTTLVEAPVVLSGSYSVPATVTSIGAGAFAGTGITSIAMPTSLTNIGYGAFQSCSQLTNFTIPDGVGNIADTTFLLCSALKSIKIPGSVTNIGPNAFQFCGSLAQVTVPGASVSLGSGAFSFCGQLTAVYFYGNAPASDASVFTLSSPTIYYLPGTTGWGATFDGRPAVLWNPKPQSIAIQANQFRFGIIGTTNIPIVVEGSADLANPSWAVLQNCTLTNGSIFFNDAQWTNYPRRYYRITHP